jgi:hypothetical protein
MEKDKEDLEFDALLADSRHKELKNVLEQIAISLSNVNNKDITLTLKSQSQRLEELVKLLYNESNKSSSIDNKKEFVSLVQEMTNQIVESNSLLIQTINERLLPDSFDLIKNMGVTQSVKVNYKPSSQI